MTRATWAFSVMNPKTIPEITQISTTIQKVPEKTSTPGKTPGFEGIVTIVGLLLIYILKRK